MRVWEEERGAGMEVQGETESEKRSGRESELVGIRDGE